MIRDRGWFSRLFDSFNYVFLALFALLCLAPMAHIFAVSLSGRAPATAGFVSFWPIDFTLENYQEVMGSRTFLRSFFISVARVLTGTSLNMVLIILTAYPLSKTPRVFKGRTIFIWFFVFAMLFDGGLIPTFLVVRGLGLLNTLGALILPNAVPIFSVILMMNFFRSVPRELEESAVIDGASHWRVLWHIYIPLSLPAIATLTLFAAVNHWNAWFDGLIYMTDAANYPMQTFLRTIVVELDLTNVGIDPRDLQRLSDRAIRGAQIIVATVPILVVYPFLQRYFISGIKLGAVKE
ncbi:MAG: carbohydrate ABC transporter permease [Chloroflexi bacterium]|nr:carbohydrate ABC transporter permease [Chloroflexota bacterium]MCY3979946.1 carbohydrate ABC transporter permease [Chloroflexota bacterium]MDE2638691.1 carbohydrate ABC transporter permease [Chloroflexota bacterium]MYE27230.1 carbohydrate ABC transporter permease [Chloroflexota bacterium]